MNPWGTPGSVLEVPESTRTLVLNRDGHMCAAVGIAALNHNDLSMQHRLNRGMGGDPDVNGPQWLMTLCVWCNVRLEQDAAFASLGRAWGWKLTRGEDPTVASVWFAWARQWRRLDTDGGYRRVIARDGRTALAGDPFAAWRDEK